ncbi:MAG: signal peptidase I [Deltaproteobacteria bacterium]|nr:signal peptidase I [Deltaproteobacteria bacterium]
MDSNAAAEGLGLIGIVIYLAIVILLIVGMWKVFSKAGKPGWACLIPIYNIVVLLEIAGKPIWWIILMLIPLINAIIFLLVSLAVAQKFGKSAGYGVGLFFLPFIFWPMLGFGDASYQ